MNLNKLVDESKKKAAEFLERRISNDLQYTERVKAAKEYQEYLEYRRKNISAFKGKECVIGYFEDNIFQIVFLDKDHEFWKTKKKNT
jgi:hypothetical protein